MAWVNPFDNDYDTAVLFRVHEAGGGNNGFGLFLSSFNNPLNNVFYQSRLNGEDSETPGPYNFRNKWTYIGLTLGDGYCKLFYCL